MNGRPRVSIGLPVFNGERFVAEAIDSILAQTFEDFELIISDNASRDGTEEICRRYAEKDERIRFVRNRENYGAAFNFNQTFHLSRGEFFKWAAHDDVLCPEFLERCVGVLDWEQTVAIAYTRMVAIDENGNRLPRGYAPWVVSSPRPYPRFRAAMRMAGRGSGPVWGLIRAGVLGQTGLQPGYPHGDHVLLAELSLYGRFHEVPEELLLHRWHPGRYVLISSQRSMTEWWIRSSSKRLPGPLGLLRMQLAPVARRGMGYVSSISRAPIHPGDRALCLVELVWWSCQKLWVRGMRRLGDGRSAARADGT